MPCCVHPGAYRCTPKSCIPASGCGPRTILDLRDHPIFRTPALRSNDQRSLAPGQKEAEEPHPIYIDKHKSTSVTLAAGETTAGTGDQAIHQTTHTDNNTRHHAIATGSISTSSTTCRSHPQPCHRGAMQIEADHRVANPKTAPTAPPAEHPLPTAARTDPESWHPSRKTSRSQLR